MNLSDNLKKIRKDNNLSQEDLAEELGVSRQSVSKWESGQAYPEMDKVIQICKMFNVKLDDLLNDDISKVEKEQKSKININKYIEDFLSFITKTIDMITSIKFKDVLKCLFEQLIIIFLSVILLKIFGGVMNDIIRNALFFLSDKVYDACYKVLEAIYSVFSIIMIMIIVIHIFKIRYLDYYSSGSKKKGEEEVNKKTHDKEESKENKKEKIIIRDPDHSGDKFVSLLVKVLLIMLKIFLLSFVCFLCFTFVSFVVFFVVSFMFIKTGTFFIGIILSILSCLLVIYIFLNLLYHFYINTKPKYITLGITFLTALVTFGVGCGLLIYNIPKFNLVNTDNKKYYVIDKETYQMTDNMLITDYFVNIEYKETNNNNVVVECKHPKVYKVYFDKDDNNNIRVERNINSQMDLLKDSIENLKHKVIVNYDNMEITVYTSKSNIEKLKQNEENYNTNANNINEVVNE